MDLAPLVTVETSHTQRLLHPFGWWPLSPPVSRKGISGREQEAKAVQQQNGEEVEWGSGGSHKVFPKAGAQLAIIDLRCDKINYKRQTDREG